MPTPILRPLVFASVLLVVAGARAQLASSSPFLPPRGAGAAAPTADAPLEFRGVAELPDGLAFRVVDPTHKKGAWVHLNERDPDLGFVVKQHDSDHDTVTVEQAGRTFTLALHQSKVSSAGAAMMSPGVMPPQMQTVAAMAQQAAATPLQQAQVDAVAAAVAQRRALRDQAAQQINQGLRIAPQVIQQQQQERAQNAPAQNTGGQNGNGQGKQNGQNGQNNQRRNRQP